VSFWDLGGQLELHGIWEKYYDECHGVAFVVDATDSARIETALAVFGTRARARRRGGA
jgi:ADP-ribosylation factor related protein 1